MKNRRIVIAGAIVLGALMTNSAMADVGVGLRAGTFGFGAEFDVGLTETLNLRLGYNTLSYDYTMEDTDVVYDGTLKIGAASAILDWHAFNGGFHFSVGAVQKGPKVDATAVPSANFTYELNDHVYSGAQIGSLTGTVKMGDSTAPYVGIGWGNPVDKEGRFTFLFDIGAIRTGAPEAELNVVCGPTVPTATCNQIRSDVAIEEAELEEEAKDYEWYPVINLGFAIRF